MTFFRKPFFDGQCQEPWDAITAQEKVSMLVVAIRELHVVHQHVDIAARDFVQQPKPGKVAGLMGAHHARTAGSHAEASRPNVAGTPYHTCPAGTSFVTTAPAPMTAPAPTLRTGSTIAPVPSSTLAPISTEPASVTDGDI